MADSATILRRIIGTALSHPSTRNRRLTEKYRQTAPISVDARRKTIRQRKIRFTTRLLAIRWNLYTFCTIRIYLSIETSIPFERNLYTYRPRDIYQSRDTDIACIRAQKFPAAKDSPPSSKETEAVLHARYGSKFKRRHYICKRKVRICTRIRWKHILKSRIRRISWT